jgi:hypothetical protein
VTDYLVMTLEDEPAHAAQPPKAMAELIEKSAAYAEALKRGGRLIDRGRLRPSREGKRVGREGGRLAVHDGPFAEEGRALGGYHWVRASDLDDATALAAEAPALATDELVVRPLMKGAMPADKEAKAGKLFACAVLGRGQTEDAWVGAMDRIDEETRGGFTETSFVGGLRLQPPRAGRRLVTRGEGRATFDGPFLESKEVIGGLFVVRMASLDEAVRWAADTAFVRHGTLEIRELWRT